MNTSTGTVTFSGPNTGAGPTSATVILSALNDANTISDSVTVSIPSSSSGADPVLAAPGLFGGARGSRTGDGVVTLTDNDVSGFEISKEKLVIEEGGSASYTVRLVTQPGADVTVTVMAGAGDVTVNQAGGTAGVSQTLTFSASGSNPWNVPQTVTVAAAHDDDTQDDSVILTHTAAGGGYDSATEMSW